VEWAEIQPLANGIFPAGAEHSFGLLAAKPIACKSPWPYLVSATVGRGHLSADEIACFGASLSDWVGADLRSSTVAARRPRARRSIGSGLDPVKHARDVDEIGGT
jgi:hypothetical protein